MVYDSFLITLAFMSEIAFFVVVVVTALYKLYLETRAARADITLLTMEVHCLAIEYGLLDKLNYGMHVANCLEWQDRDIRLRVEIAKLREN